MSAFGDPPYRFAELPDNDKITVLEDIARWAEERLAFWALEEKKPGDPTNWVNTIARNSLQPLLKACRQTAIYMKHGRLWPQGKNP